MEGDLTNGIQYVRDFHGGGAVTCQRSHICYCFYRLATRFACGQLVLRFSMSVCIYVCIFVCPHLSRVGITSSISALSQSHVVASTFPLLLSIHLEIVTVVDYS